MLFNSLHFLLFFVSLFFGYYLVPERFRRWVLLLASCYFYMVYVPAYILILFFLIVTDFLLGLRMGNAEGKKRKWLLIISIFLNLGTLFLFKYFNFFNENISALAQLLHWHYPEVVLRIALPIGLSFHVFQSLSYVIEVYRGKVEPERDLGRYALYVLFFSQLVAGPIERPQHFLPQLRQDHPFQASNVRKGLEIMLLGFFKKLVIADNLALIVDHIYGKGMETNGFVLFIAAFAFTYQLYCDFSGYSDIAVGSAQVFGYDLTNNFRRPFASRSIAEFWRRWHTSLSNWLRDYLYNPLVFSGERLSKIRIYLSLLVTFTLIGLWHGANWTYIAMGMLHGVYLVLSLVTADVRKRIITAIGLSKFPRLHQAWQTLVVFVLVTVSFVLFRAISLPQAGQVLRGMFYAPLELFSFVPQWRAWLTPAGIGVGLKTVLFLLVAIGCLEWIQYVQEKKNTPFIFDEKPRAIRFAYYYALLFAILCFGYFGAQSFIYFQF